MSHPNCLSPQPQAITVSEKIDIDHTHHCQQLELGDDVIDAYLQSTTSSLITGDIYRNRQRLPREYHGPLWDNGVVLML
jgi:hypothetical protein